MNILDIIAKKRDNKKFHTISQSDEWKYIP